MKLNAGFLIASVASFVKPFLIGTVAVGIGLTGSGGTASSFLRYLVFPHLVPAVCFFLLAVDEKKYDVFKPLTALVIGGSLLAFFASLVSAIHSPEKIFFASGDVKSLTVTAVVCLLVMITDFFCLIILATTWKQEKGSAEIPDLPPKEQ